MLGLLHGDWYLTRTGTRQDIVMNTCNCAEAKKSCFFPCSVPCSRRQVGDWPSRNTPKHHETKRAWQRCHLPLPLTKKAKRWLDWCLAKVWIGKTYGVVGKSERHVRRRQRILTLAFSVSSGSTYRISPVAGQPVWQAGATPSTNLFCRLAAGMGRNVGS